MPSDLRLVKVLFGPTGNICYVLRETKTLCEKNGMILSKKMRSEMENSTVIYYTMRWVTTRNDAGPDKLNK